MNQKPPARMIVVPAFARSLAITTMVFAVGACATEPGRADNELDSGRQLAETHCSSCHAVGVAGNSPSPEAPAFRTLSRNYRVGTLQEALAEGISVGHPAMPAFEFEPREVDALIAFLDSIQEQP
jgi:cytochrome c